MKDLQKRILDISKKLGLSHIGSCLSVLPVLIEIYEKKKPEDLVILCNAHAHLAHLVVKWWAWDDIYHAIETHGIHCDRKAGCDASGGSLGHGLGIGLGRALANPERNVYVIVSEGSMMEGSSWEALRLIDEYRPDSLHIYTNFNGYSAVQRVWVDGLADRMNLFCDDINIRRTDNTEDFAGIEGHYKKI